MRSRKRKRRARLLDEMRWNPGLRTYIARRDAWTGGVLRSSPPPPAAAAGAPPASTTAPTTSATTTTGSNSSHFPPAAAPPIIPPTDLLELVPLHPPLLPPSNPIRASITPATYASIYSKVVTQGLTPTIPINLADVTRALVQGWKADGEWPPQGGQLGAGGEGLAGAGKRRAGRGVLGGLRGGRLRRVLGLGGEGGEGEREGRGDAPGGGEGG